MTDKTFNLLIDNIVNLVVEYDYQLFVKEKDNKVIGLILGDSTFINSGLVNLDSLERIRKNKNEPKTIN